MPLGSEAIGAVPAREGRLTIVPQGRLRIAQRFIAGLTRLKQSQVPQGRKNSSAGLLSPLPGLNAFVVNDPSDKLLGYFQPSLRDEVIDILVALKRLACFPINVPNEQVKRLLPLS